MQSEPVSPPPITTTCLPLARDRAAAARRAPRRRRRRACSAGSGNPSRSGCRRARGPALRGRAAIRRRRSAPRASIVVAAATRPRASTPTSTPVRNSTPSASICAHAAVDQVLLHLEVGDAVAQQAADAVGLLEQRHRMAGARELLGAGHAGRAGADHRDALAGLLRRRHAARSSLPPSRDRRSRIRSILIVTGLSSMLSVQAASHGAGQMRPVNSGKLLVECSDVERVLPLVAIDQVVPVRDQVVDRAAVVAERDAAIHAARRLLARAPARGSGLTNSCPVSCSALAASRRPRSWRSISRSRWACPCVSSESSIIRRRRRRPGARPCSSSSARR